MQNTFMRTTVTISDETYRAASYLARAKNITLGQAIDELVRQWQEPPAPAKIGRAPNGFPIFPATGKRLTPEMVEEALAEEDDIA
jgi:hypothetical protein